MGGTFEAKLPLLDSEGREQGYICVHLLPGREPHLLLDLRNDLEKPTMLEPVQLMEAEEYRYEVYVSWAQDTSIVQVEPCEVFEPDRTDGRQGRLRTRLHTGLLPVRVSCDGVEVGIAALEVRSRKLDYLQHYQWMLRDIADQLTEAIMERFAPTEQRFHLDETKSAQTLYQRFSFLKHLVSGDVLDAAISQIMSRPHRTWIEVEELRSPGQGFPAGSGLAKYVTSAVGPRVPWKGGSVEHLPNRMPVRRTVDTLDTPENRFIRFALAHWRQVAAHVDSILALEKDTAPIRRGRREVAAVIRQLDAYLSASLFGEVGPLTHFPASSQVLQKRAGYREIFQAYVQFEAAAVISWEGGEDVYGAGQRNVAMLYEYWVFLQLASAVRRVCTEGYSEDSLFGLRSDGLGFYLKQGKQQLITGVTSRYGRTMRVELWYNRSFGRTSGPSWTMPMRPDCSIRIRPEKGSMSPFEEVWLHFDAKYRLDGLKQIFGAERESEVNEPEYLSGLDQDEKTGSVRREDLLKMHAYRDAIRRSAGAYVVYPGNDERRFNMYHEVLPGLGAFSLRPTDGGVTEGMGALEKFLGDVLDHVATQATERERERWWIRETHGDRYELENPVPAVPFLERPPADTEVLLGYVKSGDHLKWIHDHRTYNLRADDRTGSMKIDSRELAADLLILYNSRLGIVELWRLSRVLTLSGRSELLKSGYPRPRGELYYCVGLEDISPAKCPDWLTAERIEQLRSRVMKGSPLGMPAAVSWLQLTQFCTSGPEIPIRIKQYRDG